MPQEILAARPRVMIVHHAADVALKLADWIAFNGYEAAIAQDGEEGLELLREVQPDGILLDLHLRAWGGIRVLRIIKEIYPQIPVVTITEEPLNELASLSVKAGACGFLLKPIEGGSVKRQSAKSTTKTGRSSARSGEHPIEGRTTNSLPSDTGTSQTNGSHEPGDHSRERIAERAYSFYEQEGYRHGHDVEHWLKAEQEITSRDA